MKNFNLRDRFGDWWDGASGAQKTIFRVVVIAFFFALPLLNNPIIDTPETSFGSVLFYPLIMFSLMAVGLNVVVGKSGILDLGYVAFFAIGAYTHALMSMHTKLNFWEIIPFAMAFAMLAGVILGLPALRLRGDYLAIITLGFGEIVRIIAINTDAIGGAMGITDIPGPTSIPLPPTPVVDFGPFDIGPITTPHLFIDLPSKIEFTVMDPRPYYWLTLTLLLIVIWGVLRLTKRKPGRAWEAIREDEDVAEFMGVATLKYKLWAFIIGGAVGGLAGAIYASQIRSIQPELFTLNLSIMILATVVLGGMGNIWGVILGAVLLGYIPEKLRFLSDYRIIFFGLLMVVMMNLRPNGLLPRKKREKFQEKSA